MEQLGYVLLLIEDSRNRDCSVQRIDFFRVGILISIRVYCGFQMVVVVIARTRNSL